MTAVWQRARAPVTQVEPAVAEVTVFRMSRTPFTGAGAGERVTTEKVTTAVWPLRSGPVHTRVWSVRLTVPTSTPPTLAVASPA